MNHSNRKNLKNIGQLCSIRLIQKSKLDFLSTCSDLFSNYSNGKISKCSASLLQLSESNQILTHSCALKKLILKLVRWNIILFITISTNRFFIYWIRLVCRFFYSIISTDRFKPNINNNLDSIC